MSRSAIYHADLTEYCLLPHCWAVCWDGIIQYASTSLFLLTQDGLILWIVWHVFHPQHWHFRSAVVKVNCELISVQHTFLKQNRIGGNETARICNSLEVHIIFFYYYVILKKIYIVYEQKTVECISIIWQNIQLCAFTIGVMQHLPRLHCSISPAVDRKTVGQKTKNGCWETVWREHII